MLFFSFLFLSFHHTLFDGGRVGKLLIVLNQSLQTYYLEVTKTPSAGLGQGRNE